LKYLSISIISLCITLFTVSCYDESYNPGKTSKEILELKANKMVREGEILFRENCAVCHKVFGNHNFLDGVVQRYGRNFVKLYITKQDSLLKANDSIALDRKSIYSNAEFIHKFQFSEFQLNAIIVFLVKFSS
jgi:hypothetical protein